MKVLVLGQAGKDSYGILVTNTAADVHTLTDTIDENAIRSAVRALASRIKESKRKKVNGFNRIFF